MNEYFSSELNVWVFSAARFIIGNFSDPGSNHASFKHGEIYLIANLGQKAKSYSMETNILLLLLLLLYSILGNLLIQP